LSVWGFVAVRLVGLALVVPVAEELFWRGFLARWLLGPDWQTRPVGQFTPVSFAIVTLLFTLAHPEWVAAAVYCALLNGLAYWTRDLWNCVVAHAVSNLVLGGYILTTGDWKLW
jgi:CAAX prenyl protease-like protein